MHPNFYLCNKTYLLVHCILFFIIIVLKYSVSINCAVAYSKSVTFCLFFCECKKLDKKTQKFFVAAYLIKLITLYMIYVF